MTLVHKIILGFLAVLMIVALVYMSGCEERRALGDQKKIERGQTGAVIESGMDASNVQANVATNDAASAELGRSNEKEIRDAKGSDVAVAPDAQSAGLRSLCRRAAYRDRPECRMQ